MLNRTRKREFEDIFKINVACALSSNFCYKKRINANSADHLLRRRSAGQSIEG